MPLVGAIFACFQLNNRAHGLAVDSMLSLLSEEAVARGGRGTIQKR